MGNLINWIAIIIGMPLVLYLYYLVWRNRGEPWRISNLLCSITLITVAAFMIGLLSQTLALTDQLLKSGDLSAEVASQLKYSGKMWLFAFTAAAGGVGVSVLANFLQAKKPPN